MTTRYFDRTRFHFIPASKYMKYQEPVISFNANTTSTNFNKFARDAIIDLAGGEPERLQWFLSEDEATIAVAPSTVQYGAYKPSYTRSGIVCGVPMSIHKQVKGRKFQAEIVDGALFIDIEKGEV